MSFYDVEHEKPVDRSNVHKWIWEDPARHGNVLTQDGITTIAHHKYKGGEYTHLDTFMNPFWIWITENIIPMSMAPNMVTLVGSMACVTSYLTTWWFIPQFTERNQPMPMPMALLLFNGFAVFFYHTADSCDGKQARRTGTSSPLGQLFDHGLDCYAAIFTVSVAQGILLLGPTRASLLTQVAIQLTFFSTQLEEYYTGVLLHAHSKWLGVTECAYMLALGGMASAFFDRTAYFSQSLQDVLYPILPISKLPNNPNDPDPFVTVLHTVLSVQLKHCVYVGWIAMSCMLTSGCIYRTAKHVYQQYNFTSMLSALSKLFSPFLVATVMVLVTPNDVVQQDARLVCVASGLCICFITVKMIIFSMARMAYASIQLDILPIVGTLLFFAWECDYAEHRRLHPPGITFGLQAVVVFYMARIAYWTSIAIRQLCEKLDVYLLTIKPPKKG
ncbi:Uncharacterized CDP-alcohol phosphatidyltransferase class-I family protein [Seminavis robusta]|uniref:Uncharacterized CDP-alcohol phosphatidyltransferase class-I family protein n=1 Tax=Seminavis robusta TaxID=568900 RepID=A0A9N8HAW8_9STRA|nr:Uncharacterized CDP-alcohol phosphatidyltransferase class-I family protein [Seminavis robusta]|eukprot:Sro240_g096180.1 Uncharacterized CDP-alcohol phosphatidyltransferase class-I family protein (444) ;mRNA; r:65997-67423